MLIRLILCMELALFACSTAQHQMQNYVHTSTHLQDQSTRDNNIVLQALHNELQSVRRDVSTERALCQSQLAEERRQHRQHNAVVEQLRKAEEQNCQLRILQAAELSVPESDMVVVPKEGGRVIERHVKPGRDSESRTSQRLGLPGATGDSCRRRLDAAEKRHCSLRSILEDDLIDCNERLNTSRKYEQRLRQELDEAKSRCSGPNTYNNPAPFKQDTSRSHEFENLEQRWRDCRARTDMMWNEGADLRNQLIEAQNEVYRLREELQAKQPNTRVRPFEEAANSTLKIGSTTYYFSTEEVSWWFADETCNSRGWELLSIETPEEQQELERFMQGVGESRDYWSSATDLGHSHRFTWHARGTPLETFSLLKDGEPDVLSDVEHCVLTHFLPNTRGHWSDEKCERNYRYICETTRDI